MPDTVCRRAPLEAERAPRPRWPRRPSPGDLAVVPEKGWSPSASIPAPRRGQWWCRRFDSPSGVRSSPWVQVVRQPGPYTPGPQRSDPEFAGVGRCGSPAPPAAQAGCCQHVKKPRHKIGQTYVISNGPTTRSAPIRRRIPHEHPHPHRRRIAAAAGIAALAAAPASAAPANGVPGRRHCDAEDPWPAQLVRENGVPVAAAVANGVTVRSEEDIAGRCLGPALPGRARRPPRRLDSIFVYPGAADPSASHPPAAQRSHTPGAAPSRAAGTSVVVPAAPSRAGARRTGGVGTAT